MLVPVYVGISLARGALGVKFFQEVFHVLSHIWTMQEAHMVLVASLAGW